MGVGFSKTFDFKGLKDFVNKANEAFSSFDGGSDTVKKFKKEIGNLSEAQKAFAELNIEANSLAAGLASIAMKSPLNGMISTTLKLTKAFEGLRDVLLVAFLPLKMAETLLGGIFSIIRSIVATPLNFASGVFDGLKNAFTSMSDFASDRAGSWWGAQKQRTSTGNLLALERTEKTYGMDGMLSGAGAAFASSLNDYSKMSGLLSSGLKNSDIEAYKKMDSSQAMFDALAKIRDNASVKGFNANSRAYFDSTGIGDAFGLSFEEYTKLLDVLPEVTTDFRRFSKMISTNDKTMISVNRTSNQLGVAFDNLKTMLITRLGPPLMKLVQTLTPLINQLASSLFSSENMKMISEGLTKFAGKIKEFVTNDGLSKLKEWFEMLLEVIKSTIKGASWFLNKAGFMNDDTYKSIMDAFSSVRESVERRLKEAGFTPSGAFGTMTSSDSVKAGRSLTTQKNAITSAYGQLDAETNAFVNNAINSIRSGGGNYAWGDIKLEGQKAVLYLKDKKGNTVERKEILEIKSDMATRAGR